MALRSFAYDDPNYTLTRQHCAPGADVASGVNFASFRSRVKVVVNSITAVITSAASAASAVYTVLRNASANTTFTFGSGTAGNMTVISCAITLESAGDLLSIKSGQGGGEYQILYEYNVIPGASLYSNQ